MSFRIVPASWADDRARLQEVRFSVFVEEQRVPIEEEIDAWDPVSFHLLALTEDGAPVGTGRLLPDGHIGRMAVSAERRGRGIGGAILEALVAEAWRRGDETVVLAAQLHAIPFYTAHGFRVWGAIFLDAGIEHRWMDRTRS